MLACLHARRPRGGAPERRAIAEDMSAREIAEAQRQARAWLADIADRRAA